MQDFFGTGVALITPFMNDGAVDYEALEKLVHLQIDNGVDYLVVLGTTGEPATLSVEEQEKVKKKIIEANDKRLPLVLGVGGNNTMAVAASLKSLDLSAYQAVLSVSPYYNKPTQEGIYQHFKVISEASPLPIILYNVPGRTAQNMSPETVLRLANDFDNIIGVKEAAGVMEQAEELLKNKPDNFLVISGDDMIALPMTLKGGAGVISVVGQAYPEDFSRMIKLGLNGEETRAYVIHNSFVECIDLIFEEGNPAGIKSLLKTIGVSGDGVRLPLVKATPKLEEKIINFARNY